MTAVNSTTIKHKAAELGLTKVGIVPAVALVEEGQRLQEWIARGFPGQLEYMIRDPEKRSDPRLLMPSARSVICVALNYYNPEAHPDSPETGKVSKYAWGDDYHEVLKARLQALAKWIRETDPSIETKACVDTAPVMEKAWAVRAGLGWLGKHTNLITRDHGSWLFLGVLLVSIDLEYESRIETDHCGKCTACIDACPTQAIVEPYQLDASRCISYGTIEVKDDTIPAEIASNLDGWVFGCDVCQDVCPWNRFSKPSSEPAFNPRPGIAALNLEHISTMSQEEFSSRFRLSPVKRAKLKGLKRNAAALQNARKQGV